jgi:hypothetical protein
VTRRATLAAGLTILFLALNACDLSKTEPTPASSSPSPASLQLTPRPSPSLEAGWSLHPDAAEGYVIAFPNTWDPLFKDSGSFDNDLTTINGKNAELGKYFREGFKNGTDNGLKLIAAEPRSVLSGFITNLSLFKSDLGPRDKAPDLDGISSSKRTLIARTEGVTGDVKHERVTIPAGTAERLQYSMKPNDKSVAVVSFLANVDDAGHRFLYEILIGTTVQDYTSLFERIVNSFRLTGGQAGPSAAASATGSGPAPSPSASRR